MSKIDEEKLIIQRNRKVRVKRMEIRDEKKEGAGMKEMRRHAFRPFKGPFGRNGPGCPSLISPEGRIVRVGPFAAGRTRGRRDDGEGLGEVVSRDPSRAPNLTS